MQLRFYQPHNRRSVHQLWFARCSVCRTPLNTAQNAPVDADCAQWRYVIDIILYERDAVVMGDAVLGSDKRDVCHSLCTAAQSFNMASVWR